MPETRTFAALCAMISLAVLCRSASISAAGIMPPPQPKAQATLQPSGAIAVQSLPEGAGIWLDGSYIGPAPLMLGAIPAGRHTITLTKSGWRTAEFTVYLSAGATLMEVHRLAELPSGKLPRTGEIVLHQPRELRDVRIDGERYSPRTPVNGAGNPTMILNAGPHVISADVNGTAVRRGFVVLADTQTELVLDAQAPDTAARLVEPADSALPAGSLLLQGRKIIITVGAHRAIGHLEDPDIRLDGRTIVLDPPPVMVGRHLYLPVGFVDQLLHL